MELDTVGHCTEEQGTGLQDTEGGQVGMDKYCSRAAEMRQHYMSKN